MYVTRKTNTGSNENIYIYIYEVLVYILLCVRHLRFDYFASSQLRSKQSSQTLVNTHPNSCKYQITKNYYINTIPPKYKKNKKRVRHRKATSENSITYNWRFYNTNVGNKKGRAACRQNIYERAREEHNLNHRQGRARPSLAVIFAIL